MAKRPPPPSRAARIRAGAEAWKRIKGRDTWEGWPQTCDALLLLRNDAMRIAKCDEPTGGPYRAAMHELLAQHQMADIPTTTRAAAIKIAPHLARIERHRAFCKTTDFPTYLKLQLGPQTVWTTMRPILMTDLEREIAERKRQERALKRRVEQQQAKAADIELMTETELAEWIHEQIDDTQFNLLLRRMIQLYAKDAVVLLPGASPGELGDILINSYGLDNVAAYALIRELHGRFAPPQEAETPEPEVDLPKPPIADGISDEVRAQLDALDRQMEGGGDDE